MILHQPLTEKNQGPLQHGPASKKHHPEQIGHIDNDLSDLSRLLVDHVDR